MSHKKSSLVNGKSLTTGRTLDDQELAQLLALPTWNRQQAEQILQAQVASGQGIAAFAKQRGLQAGRIYNWKTKLKEKSLRADPSGGTEEQEEPSPRVLGAELDLEDPGERHAQEYLEWATRGPDQKWHLLGLRRSGLVLLCAVRWVRHAPCPKPCSLVHLALNEPALWWKEFATEQEALQALQQPSASPLARDEKDGNVAGPGLVRVAVRTLMVPPQREPAESASGRAQRNWITVCMPAGERIQIPPGVPEALIHSVLRTVRSPSC